jgi:hypothetical protein
MVNKNNLKNISYNTLSILIDQDGFSFYLQHSNPEDCLSVAKIEVEDIFSLKSLKNFKNHYKEISSTYKFIDVKVAFANAYYSFVPKDYYVEEAKADYLKYNVELFEEDQISSDFIEGLNVHQVYIPLMNYHNIILEKIEEFEYQHFTNYLIDDCRPKYFENKIFINVYVRKSSLDIIAFEGMKFKLCNTFEYDTDFDLAYYVLFAVEELKFNQIELQMNIYHNSETTSWLEILELYIKNINCKSVDLTTFIK